MGRWYVILAGRGGPVAGQVLSALISKVRRYEHGYRSKFAKHSTPTMRHLPLRAATLPPTNLQGVHMSGSSQFSQCFPYSTPFTEQGKHLPSLIVILTLP